MARPLKNYVRTHRKRAGLSQADVAYLLGATNSSKVSRHERFVRKPSLETALAYEAVFQTPVAEMLAGVFDDVRRAVGRRAKALLERLQKQPTSRTKSRRMEVLGAIAEATGE